MCIDLIRVFYYLFKGAIHKSSSSNNLGLMTPLLIAIGSFLLGIYWKDYERKRDIRKNLNKDIFEACEKLFRYINLCNHYILAARYHYALLNLGEEKELNERFYFKFYDGAEELRQKYIICQVDLIKNMQELKTFGEKKKATIIHELMSKVEYSPISGYDGIFNEKMTKYEIENIYKKEINKTNNNLKNENFIKNLRAIQNEVCPYIPINKGI